MLLCLTLTLHVNKLFPPDIIMTLDIHLMESGLFVLASFLTGIGHLQHYAPFYLKRNPGGLIIYKVLENNSKQNLNLHHYKLEIALMSQQNYNSNSSNSQNSKTTKFDNHEDPTEGETTLEIRWTNW